MLRDMIDKTGNRGWNGRNMNLQTLREFYLRLPVVREIAQIKASLRSIQRDISCLQQIAASRELGKLRGRHPGETDPLRLHRFENQVCSQNGEDGVIAEIFQRIGETDRTFVEVGCGGDGENNTSFLCARGWSGFWVDSDPAAGRLLERTRGERRIRLRTAMVTRENITGIFEELGVPPEFDFLSVDVDQNTYHIWAALRAYRPRVAVIEYNAAFPPGFDWKVVYDASAAWDGTINNGASLTALENLGREMGYSLVHCDSVGVNAFFVRTDLAEGKFAAPFDAANHYEPPRHALAHRACHGSGLPDMLP